MLAQTHSMQKRAVYSPQTTVAFRRGGFRSGFEPSGQCEAVPLPQSGWAACRSPGSCHPATTPRPPPPALAEAIALRAVVAARFLRAQMERDIMGMRW